MNRLKQWITNKNKREILVFLGLPIGAIMTAAIALSTYDPSKSSTSEIHFTVCKSGEASRCPAGALVIGCRKEDTVQKAVDKECDMLTFEVTSQRNFYGGKCGIRIVEAKCTTSR
jgi:hypothetical protein